MPVAPFVRLRARRGHRLLCAWLLAAVWGAGTPSFAQPEPGPVLREGRAQPARRAAAPGAPASAPIAIDLRVPPALAQPPGARASAPGRRAVATSRLRGAGASNEMEALRERISVRLRQLREREEAAAPARRPAAVPRAPSPRTATALTLAAGGAAAATTAAKADADALDPGETRVDGPSSPAPSVSSAAPSSTAPSATAPTVGAPPSRVLDPRPIDPRGLPWAYAGPAGPQAWGRLKPEYALCARGQRQSPIALRDGLAVDLDALGFDYPALPLTVHDTGRALEATVRGSAALVLRGERYPLVRISLHRPGQGSIDGRRHPMSVQLLHRDAQGRQVMVALMVEPGAPQPVLQQLLNNLPLEPSGVQAAAEPVSLGALLPERRGYWTYMGSLTEPPCTEGVLWIVLQQPITASAEQLALFARLHPENARPDQPVAGRRIKVSR